MSEFTSCISGRKYPSSEKVHVKMIRDGLAKELRKDYPELDPNGYISHSELNLYREKYIQELLTKEMGTLSELEHTVLDTINKNQFISEASDIRKTATSGQRMADRIASFGGSWKFISIFIVFLLLWMILNIWLLHNKGFDPYPFILLNLILSCIAAIQAPVIMMSQNRQEEKDRERARNDYMVNLKSEVEIRMLHEKMDHLIMIQQQNLMEVQQIQIDMIREIIEKVNEEKDSSGK